MKKGNLRCKILLIVLMILVLVTIKFAYDKDCAKRNLQDRVDNIFRMYLINMNESIRVLNEDNVNIDLEDAQYFKQYALSNLYGAYNTVFITSNTESHVDLRNAIGELISYFEEELKTQNRIGSEQATKLDELTYNLSTNISEENAKRLFLSIKKLVNDK